MRSDPPTKKRTSALPPFLTSGTAAHRYAREAFGDSASTDLSVYRGMDKEERDEVIRAAAEELEERAYDYAQFAIEAARKSRLVVYRAIAIPKSARTMDAIRFDCLGKSWSARRSGAGVYNGSAYRGETRTVTITAEVNPASVDWEFGFRSFLIYGASQWEISLLEHVPVRVVALDDVPLKPSIDGSSGEAGEGWSSTCGRKRPTEARHDARGSKNKPGRRANPRERGQAHKRQRSTATELKFDPEKWLYHGTLRTHAARIAREWLQPRIGDFVASEYAGSGDVDDDESFRPLVFAADASEIRKVATALCAQVAIEMGVGFHAVTDRDVAERGALVLIDKAYAGSRSDATGDVIFRQRRRGDEDRAGRHPPHVEPGDWYSFEHVRPAKVLTGDAMMRVLRDVLASAPTDPRSCARSRASNPPEPQFVTLYHGTCEANAVALLASGWKPRQRARGANQGRTDMLYCSTGAADALWFAQQKDCDTVVRLSRVPVSVLGIDPEDGMGSTVAEELTMTSQINLPAKLTVRVPLGASFFSRVNDPWRE